LVEALKADMRGLQSAYQEMERKCIIKERLLKAARQECEDLRIKLIDSIKASELKVASQLKASCDAVAAAEERAAIAVRAAEARVLQYKASAASEIQRCRSETERLVAELGEGKATINDYMWRCEAMSSSLTSAQQNVTCASEATAAAERLMTAELETANRRAQETQAAAEAETRAWREEAARLQGAVAESNATVDRFIQHSCSLQQRLDVSQAECLDLRMLLARILRAISRYLAVSFLHFNDAN
jgi:hypothetical protein